MVLHIGTSLDKIKRFCSDNAAGFFLNGKGSLAGLDRPHFSVSGDGNYAPASTVQLFSVATSLGDEVSSKMLLKKCPWKKN